MVKGFARFPTPFIYIYFFHFPYERLEKPENPQQPETPSYKCADVCTNFSDDWAICLPNLLNRFNIYSDLSPRGDKFRTVFLCPRGHKINQRNFTFVFSIHTLIQRATIAKVVKCYLSGNLLFCFSWPINIAIYSFPRQLLLTGKTIYDEYPYNSAKE